jgi:hypothetical protein
VNLFRRKYPARPEISGEGPWALLKGQHNGRIMIIRANTGLRNCIGHPEYPYRVGIAVPFAAPDAEGLPSSNEIPQLDVIEDALCDQLLTGNESLLAVVITTGGMREFVLHTTAPERVKVKFEKLKGMIETHELQMIIEMDKPWKVYKEFSKS